MTNKKQNIALIVAGGRGQRAGDGPPKQYRKLPDQDETVLTKTMRIFLSHENIDGVCVIIHKDDIALYEAACADIAALAPFPQNISFASADLTSNAMDLNDSRVE